MREGGVDMVSRHSELPLKYVLEQTSFHEYTIGNITIKDAMGPAHIGASFVIYGNINLEDNKRLYISVSAKTVFFPPTAGLVSLEWDANGTLRKNGQNLVTKAIKRNHEFYFTPVDRTVIGEACFELPEFTDRNEVELYLEAIYSANFGPLGNAMPHNPVLPMNRAYLKKTFPIYVTYE